MPRSGVIYLQTAGQRYPKVEQILPKKRTKFAKTAV